MSPLDPALHARLEALLQVLDAAGTSSPVFAHLRLRTPRRELDVLLGTANRTFSRGTIIDWQAAPLAEVFFLFDENETYEIDEADRSITGVLLQKNVLTFEQGELVRVDTPKQRLIRTGVDWSEQPLEPARVLAPRPPEARKPFRSPLEVTLDPAQQRVVDLPPRENVLVLGEAGFGKTTVALHRLVALREKNLDFRAAVLVPTEGLKRLTELMLERRGIEDIEVSTYDAWASELSRSVFPDLPKRESSSHAAVTALKRHPALRPVLEQFIVSHPTPTFDEDRPTHSKHLARRADLELLFGERSTMQRVVDGAQGALRQTAVGDVAEHTRVQFLDSTEQAYSHVDRASLATVDGRSIDDGTPTEDAFTVDPEDHAVMFELERMRARASGRKPISLARYHCVMLDEAQEFAALELALIGRTLLPEGSVIVAGDAAQQVDPSSFFSGWAEVMRDVSAPQHTRAVLEVNYRCPPDVTALARSIIDPALPAPVAHPTIAVVTSPSLFHQAAWLGAALRDVQRVDPWASIAIICRTAEGAKAFARTVRHEVTPRIALDGLFDFKPGLILTCVAEVKGLEFDLIVVPDATATTFTESGDSRRALYVGVTRTTHRLTLASPGVLTRLVRL